MATSVPDFRQGTMQGRTVLIIGGSSGIGLATARFCAASGAQVIIASRDAARREAALKQIGTGTLGRYVDLARTETIDALFQDAALASLDHLVFLPPPAALAPIGELPLADIRAHFEHAVVAAFHCAQLALPKMKQVPESSLCFVTGALSRSPQPGTTAIVAAQHATEGLALTLAREVAPIRANVLVPGVVETPFWDSLPPANREAIYDDARTKSLTGRISTPEQIADACVTLLANPFITGTAFVVDGGWSR